MILGLERNQPAAEGRLPASRDGDAPGILVVDDDAGVRDKMVRLFRAEGYRAWGAASGDEALRVARECPPDLVLLDVSMPGVDGLEVCSHLCRNVREAPLVIFVSALGERQDRIRGLEVGAVDYVVKPFDVDELTARVRAALRTKSRMDALAADAWTDPLTGLGNRSHLLERMAAWIAGAERDGRGLACLMIDIDEFKRINDRDGHEAGDEVLREVASRLRRACRTADALIRYGGEEFLVATSNLSREASLVLAERARRVVADEAFSIHSFGRRVLRRITASVGVAHWTRGTTGIELIRLADEALLQAKRSGRNRVVVA